MAHAPHVSTPDSETFPGRRFQHFLWRKHKSTSSWAGFRPEIIATDGRRIRRMISEPQQIVFQTFDDTSCASAIVERIEASATPGLSFLGYSMFEDQDALALMHTGAQLEPGWLAFPCTPGFQNPLFPKRNVLPKHISDIPRLRLLGGLSVYWSRRKLIAHVALEQRSDDPRYENLNLLASLKDIQLTALVQTRDTQRSLDLLTDDGILQSLHLTEQGRRAEALFELQPSIYQEAQRLNASFWFVLDMQRELFCLPDEWKRFWMRASIS